MSKKWRVKLLVAMLLFISVSTACSTDSQAAKKKNKQKVTWKLKKGTLTIYGKGKARWIAMKKKQRNKIKKVVIKKGITSIADYAFEDMKKLKTVKIPSTVKKIGSLSFAGTAIEKLNVPSSVRKIGDHAFVISKLKNLTLPGDFTLTLRDNDATDRVAGNFLDNRNLTVTFNTKLKLDNVSLFEAKRYVVSKKDPKYCSIDGSIYTKDKKTLVKVPILMKKLTIAEGCTEFCLQSVLHGINTDDALYPSCLVSEIEIPASVKTVESKKYHQNTNKVCWPPKIKRLTIRTKQLDGRSLSALVYDLNIDQKELMRQLPGQVVYRDGKYFSRDGVLLQKDPIYNMNLTY